ncbi:MAG: FAD-binding protein [Ruminococcus sp.]|nr:FAD-binding protein [Ruminococcus sp.]
MENTYDVIIAGCGAAGLYGAINLPRSCKVLLLCKQELTLCNSALAQGGIAAVYQPTNDSTDLHKQDTLIAGGFKNNPETVQILVDNAKYEIQSILDMGVDFDRTPDGELHRTLEGGHSRHRIFHHKDSTGAAILDTLIRKVKTLENVTILENTMMVDLKKTGTGFSVQMLRNGTLSTAHSHFMLLATGGIGRIYEFTTNSKIATGDGIAMAYNIGAEIRNLHLIQFHPTAFNNHHTRECLLVSEAVRGEGAYLLNCHKERFMHLYDERLELAPRDVVSHSIVTEARRTGSTDFYLDISRKDPEFIKRRFPMIYENVLAQGYDMTKEPIPIYPCQHYLMGGIHVNTQSETTVPNLFACGECSHTGVHGNNRLASNSLLEALVFSRQAALTISERMSTCPDTFEEAVFPAQENAKPLPTGFRTEIRHLMQESCFVIPDTAKLLDGFERIKEIRKTLTTESYEIDSNYVEAKSLATIGYLILKEVI